MRSGALKDRIFIEKAVEASNDFGEQIVSWESITTELIPASVYAVRGTESYMSNEKHAQATNEIHIRFLRGVTAKHRITWDDRHEQRLRVFDIISTINVGNRNKHLKIIAKEQV